MGPLNIVTAQQIAILGGPLYILYKVLGAVKKAEELEGQAIYWLECNDADFREISVFSYLSSRDELASMRWEKFTGGSPIGYVKIDERLIETIKTYYQSIGDFKYKQETQSMLVHTYRLGRTLLEASLDLAKIIFALFNLRYFHPGEKDFRHFSQTILQNEIKKTLDGEQAGAFLLQNQIRKALFRRGKTMITRAGDVIDPANEILLPHLKTRNVCQDSYFSAKYYIAGPGEMSYLKTLQSQYRYHQVLPAKPIPRMSLTLIEAEIEEAFEDLDIELDERLVESPELFREVVLGKDRLQNNKRRFKTLKNRVVAERRMLGLPWKKFERIAYTQLKAETGKRRRAWKKSKEDKLKLVRKIEQNLWPFGLKQERVFNVFHYANKYGLKKIVHKIYESYDFNKKILKI